MNNKKSTIVILIILFTTAIIISYNNFNKIYNQKIIYKLNIIEKNKKLEKKKNNQYKKIKEINNEINNINKNIKKLTENKIDLENKLKDKEEVENGKVIYLTFDDGPSKYTDNILNILDKYNVKATFFLVCSNNLEEYTKKYIQKGHTIGLHSCSHNYKQIYSSKDAYFEDLNKLKNRISISSGYDSIFLRFPGGSSNTVSKFNKGIMSSLTREVEQNGYRYYDWNVDSNDAGGANEKQVYENVINSLKKNDRNKVVVLMHDTKETTKNSLENIIKESINLGYTFSEINYATPMIHHSINN